MSVVATNLFTILYSKPQCLYGLSSYLHDNLNQALFHQNHTCMSQQQPPSVKYDNP